MVNNALFLLSTLKNEQKMRNLDQFYTFMLIKPLCIDRKKCKIMADLFICLFNNHSG